MEEEHRKSVAVTPANKSTKTSSLFSTARGSSVKISLNSIAKASSVLSSEQTESSRPSKQSSDPASSTSHDSRPIATNAASNTRYPMESYNPSISDPYNAHNAPTTVPLISPLPPSTCATPLMFQTARGKQVIISKEALEKTKAFFQDNSPSFDYIIPIDKYSSETPLLKHTTSITSDPARDNAAGGADCMKQFTTSNHDRQLKDTSIQAQSSVHMIDQPINRFDKQLAETETSTYACDEQRPAVPVQSENIDSNITNREKVPAMVIAASGYLSGYDERSYENTYGTDESFAVPLKRPRYSSASGNSDDKLLSESSSLPTASHLHKPLYQTDTVISIFSREYLLNSPIFLKDIREPVHNIDINRYEIEATNEMIVQESTPAMNIFSTLRYEVLLQIRSANALNIRLDERQNISMGAAENEEMLQEAYNSVSELPLSKSMKGWVHEQLRWIIWSSASYERKHHERYFNRLLLPAQIYSCLKHRYNIFVGSGKLDAVVSYNPSSSSKRKAGHVSAIEYFQQNKNAMSPLQRAAETLIFRFPMILCFSISKLETPSSHAESSSADGYFVNDGWTSVRVIVDAGILQLVKQNKLRDGTKVVVFAGTISMDHREAVLSVTINNIRKAKATARLGFCHPKYLVRGLSIKSIAPGLNRPEYISLCV
jgi:hypothetical protein